jgi:type VI secretion system protein ImpC
VEQTVHDIAATNIWDVTLRASLEPALDLIVIADTAGAWPVLADGVRRLVHLLGHLGGFRTVRGFTLVHRADRLAIHAGLSRGRGVEVSPRRLRDPTGRSLVLLVSDATGRGWWDDRVPVLLEAIAPRQALLVQTLPSHLWPMTGLRRHVRDADLKTAAAFGDTLEVTAPIPVAELSPTGLAAWTRMWATGRPQGGVRFPRHGGPAEERPPSDPSQTVHHYLTHRSWHARRLALLMSLLPSPAFTAEVVRLVREALVPGAGIVHEAEFFLGGLLVAADAGVIDGQGTPVFRFIQGAGQALRQRGTPSEARSVVAAVARWLERHWNQAQTFQAMLYTGSGHNEVFSRGGPFVEIASDLLKRFAPPPRNARSDKERFVAPQARVNIRYRSGSVDGLPDIELPLRILVLGEFTQRTAGNAGRERRPCNINSKLFDDVMESMRVSVELSVGHASEADTKITLQFNSLSDFRPEGIMAQVPVLQSLLDLRGGILHVQNSFEKYGSANPVPEYRERLMQVLHSQHQHHPEESMAELAIRLSRRSLVDHAEDPAPDSELFQALNLPEDSPIPKTAAWVYFALLLRAYREGETVNSRREKVENLVGAIDAELTAQVNSLLHAPEVAGLEAAWRGLNFLIDTIDFTENIYVDMLDINKEELLEDFRDAPEIRHTSLHRNVYYELAGLYGGKPYGVICSTHSFGVGAEDMEVLDGCARIAEGALAPFITNASPTMLGVTNFSDFAHSTDVEHLFEGVRYRRWHSFRGSTAARFIGLCLPRFRLRAAYGERAGERGSTDFMFIESPVNDLWGPASLALTSCIARSFARYRICANFIGPFSGGAVGGLSGQTVKTDGGWVHRSPLELDLSDRGEFELSEQGFIALIGGTGKNTAFFSANSALRPTTFPRTPEGMASHRDSILETRLPYLFILTRILHYLKVIHRERIGERGGRLQLEREFDGFVRQYCANMPDPSAEVQARRPFRHASVHLEEIPGQNNLLRCTLRILPGWKYEGEEFVLSLSTRIETA